MSMSSAVVTRDCALRFTGGEVCISMSTDVLTRGIALFVFTLCRFFVRAQAARGMLYLHTHSPPVVHRDLKSSNLVVDEHWHVKVR